MKFEINPKRCNVCGYGVKLIKNSKIYGKPYGSGYCYYCTSCGAFVNTSKSNFMNATGILANEKMRKLRSECNRIINLIANKVPHAVNKKTKYLIMNFDYYKLYDLKNNLINFCASNNISIQSNNKRRTKK